MTGETLAATLETIRERTTPADSERERLQTVAATLERRAQEAVEGLPSPADEADLVRVGSTARDTWLPGDRDVDLFVRFPPTLDRAELERYGLRVGHETVPDGTEEYAEHPYVTGVVDGFDVDLVPCFDVATASDIRSAVDRSPFHTAYLRAQLTDRLAADVRVCKQFTTAIGVYGSDLRTRGFSGYLVELLVVAHDGFGPLVEAAADWEPPVRLDPAAHGTATFDDPLVVIDPTDPQRNVAAVCSAANVARFQHHARAMLADPDPDRFERTEPEPMTQESMEAHIDRRGTAPLAVVFDTPALVDDKLYPQLRRSLNGLTGKLADLGFRVVRATVFATPSDGDGGRTAALFVELETSRLPAIRRHEGPPVSVRSHAEGFAQAYADGDAYGPYLDGDRYVVERAREYRDAEAFVRSADLFGIALGTDIEAALDDGYEVMRGAATAALADQFPTQLADYFDPSV